jgi:hypothetical protein
MKNGLTLGADSHRSRLKGQALTATTEYHVLTHEQPNPGLTSPAF